MKNARKKKLLRLRDRMNKKRPHFKRFESWRFIRIKDQWRRPRGIDNHMRTEEKGWPKSVKSGYRGPVAVRGLHPSGREEVIVWNTKDLDKVNSKTQAARIGGSVGDKKKEKIVSRAEKLDLKVLNPGVGKSEDVFEELTDTEEEQGSDEE